MRRRCPSCAKALIRRGDPVDVQPRRRYASVAVDVWPYRLSDEGIDRVAAAFRGASRNRRGFSYGRSGGYGHWIKRAAADDLADELRRIAWDADCLEAVEMAA